MNRLRFPVLLLIVLTWTAMSPLALRAEPPSAIVVSDPSLPESGGASALRLAELLRKGGYDPTIFTCDEAAEPGLLQPARCALLVLPQARNSA